MSGQLMFAQPPWKVRGELLEAWDSEVPASRDMVRLSHTYDV